MRIKMEWMQQGVVALVTLAAFAGAVALPILTFTHKFPFQGYFFDGLAYAFAGGLLGGGIFMARGFYKSVMSIEHPFDFERFFWWYFFRLIICGPAGAVAFIVAYLSLDIENTSKNLVAFFLVGVLSGYNFTGFANGKLGEISRSS